MSDNVSQGSYWSWRSDVALAGPNDIHECSFYSKVEKIINIQECFHSVWEKLDKLTKQQVCKESNFHARYPSYDSFCPTS